MDKLGKLYIVATPIGNLEDITLRALRVLKEADLIVCEDTRVTKKLLDRYEIQKPLLSYHHHSKLSRVEKIEKQTKPELKIRHKKNDQAHLVLGFRGYDMFHKDRFVLALLANILGGTMSSRLFLSVREKLGLAYYVSASDEESSDCGYFSVRAGVDTDRAKIEKTVKVILGEIRKIRARGVSEKELKKAKDNLRGKMALSLESSDEVAAYLAGQELSRREIKTPEQILAKIDKVGKNDILRVARKVFVDNKLNLALIGPVEDGKFLEKIMKL